MSNKVTETKHMPKAKQEDQSGANYYEDVEILAGFFNRDPYLFKAFSGVPVKGISMEIFATKKK